jgi:hypothetical protein
MAGLGKAGGHRQLSFTINSPQRRSAAFIVYTVCRIKDAWAAVLMATEHAST